MYKVWSVHLIEEYLRHTLYGMQLQLLLLAGIAFRARLNLLYDAE